MKVTLIVTRQKPILSIILINYFCSAFIKNPAYGRHQISQTILMEAPIQKNTQKKEDFSSFWGDLVKRGWAAVHSTAEHWSIFESIELHCTSLICSALH